MFTIEFQPDHTIVTSLDEDDMCEDIQMVLTEESVYLVQHDYELRETLTILISFQQLLDLFASLDRSEGSYYVERKDNAS
jgi:anti-sigma regulatory factor (Ser/Thr protein kinase)